MLGIETLLNIPHTGEFIQKNANYPVIQPLNRISQLINFKVRWAYGGWNSI